MMTIPNTDDPKLAAECIRHLATGMIELNRFLLNVDPLPPMYESDVRFQPEPIERNLQWDEVPDCVTIVKTGFADCAPLCLWRIAELRNKGEQASLIIYWRSLATVAGHSVRKMHAQVRRGDGKREDPSRLLGMVSSTAD